MNPIIISIEGNIGAGKSTMINHIKNLHPEWNIIDEPVDSWLGMKDENGKHYVIDVDTEEILGAK